MSALRRRAMVWLWLLVLFSGRADGVAVLLSARLASSGSDANVCASGNQLYRAVWLWSDTRKLLDEFLAAGNILASDGGRVHATQPLRPSPAGRVGPGGAGGVRGTLRRN